MYKKNNIFSLSAYDYDLPKELIAQKPANPADSCKLLIFNRKNNQIIDEIFYNLPKYLNGTEIFFFNNTKVIKARLLFKKLEKKDNTYIVSFTNNLLEADFEIFYLNIIGENKFEALIRPGKKLKPGKKLIEKSSNIIFEIIEYGQSGRIVKITNGNLEKILETYGLMPLPPYIEYSKEKEKPYQPIFAQKPGSVASPTASLHFTEKLLNKLKEKGCKFEYTTLHIGLGTFKKVDTEDITKYNIHSETVEINLDIFEKIAKYKLNKNFIIAVGTTVTRTLESLPYLWLEIKNNQKITSNLSQNTINFWNKLTKIIKNNNQIIKKIVYNGYNGEKNHLGFNTKLFIYPGFKFKIIDQLITNFHLPKSSLLMLVAAFMGYENMLKTYQHAIEKKYKFFSFGDAMRIV